MKPVPTKDYDIRALIVRTLLTAQIPREAIRHEITLNSSSSDGRADIVVALDECISGIEIKSGKDTLKLLDTQGPRYAARFNHMVLVSDAKHYEAIRQREHGCYFGRCIVIADRRDGGELFLRNEYGGIAIAKLLGRAWEQNHSRRVSATAVLEMLWQTETARIRGGSSTATRNSCIPFLAEALPMRELRPLVAQALRARQLNRWEEAFWARFDAEQIQVAA